MQRIYITTRTLGRYGKRRKQELSKFLELNIDPQADTKLIIRYLKILKLLQPNHKFEDIPKCNLCPPPQTGMIIVIKVHQDSHSDEPTGSVWEILNDDHEDIRIFYPLRDAS